MSLNANDVKKTFSGFAEQRHIENYKLFRGKFSLECQKNSNFRRAVEEMDNFILDPLKYRSNAFAHSIKIKKEDGFVEMKKSIQCIERKNESNLVTKIVSLKDENHRMCYELN